MLPPLLLAGDVNVSKDFNLSEASVELDSPESAPPVVISGGTSAWEPLHYRQRTKPTGRSEQLER